MGEIVSNDIYFGRSHGLLSKSLSSKRVLLVGLGSGGSHIAEQLVRNGVGRLTLVDPDIVEAANISRSIYVLEDIGQPKVAALSNTLRRINKGLDLHLVQKNLFDLSADELKDLIGESDLVLGLTGAPRAQLALSRFAYKLGVPAIFGSLYAGAKGGEAVLSISEKTACYQCATSSRHQELYDQDSLGSLDYGTGELHGEVALSCDVQYLDSIIVKLSLSLLTDEESLVMHSFARKVIDEGSTYLMVYMSPDNPFSDTVFADTMGQYAYQSIWAVPVPIPDCPVCGDESTRVDPLSIPLGVPSINREGLLKSESGGR